MSYTYGMQGAPAVGGGLGGLPRRKDTSLSISQYDQFMRQVVSLYGFDGSSSDESFTSTMVLNSGALVTSAIASNPLKGSSGQLDLTATGAYGSIAVSDALKFQGDFTIEGWFYSSNWSTTPGGTGIKSIFGSATTAQAGLLEIFAVGPPFNDVRCSLHTVGVVCSAPISLLTNSSFNHIAIVRYGASFKIYINGFSGTSLIDSTITINSSVTALGLGRTTYDNTYTDTSLLGYVDELRLTRDVCRYTSNFTPIKSLFPR